VLERGSELQSVPAIERLSPSSAFRALLPHAFCFDLRDAPSKRRMAERYLELVARVPCFQVRFAPDLPGLPSLLDAVEQMVIRAGAGGSHRA
jgi:hypothetical protein